MRLCIASILLWSFAAASAQITDGVYHPNRLADGTIDPADFASVPAGRWHTFGDSSYTALRAAIVDAFKARYQTENIGWKTIDVGHGDVQSALNGWSSCLHDTGRDWIACNHPGGHTNGIVTGIWAWDILRARWRIPRAPADPRAWPADYKRTYSQTSFPRAELPAEIAALTPWDGTLPDASPTARHSYGGEIHDTSRDAYVTLRMSAWAYDHAADAYTVKVLNEAGTDYRVQYPFCVFDEHSGQALCQLRRYAGDYYAWRWVDLETGTMTKGPALVSGNFKGQAGHLFRLPGTAQVVAISSDNKTGEKFSVYDLQRRAFVTRDQPIAGGVAYDYQNELWTMAYVPAWQVWLRRMDKLKDGTTCRWFTFDHVTGQQQAVAFDPNPSCARHIGRKLVYSAPLDALVGIMSNDATAVNGAVWFMRIGDAPPPAAIVTPPPARDDLQRQIDNGGPVVVIEPGRYYGSAKITGAKTVDFANVTIVGPDNHGAVVAQGGPVVIKNLRFTGPYKSCVWVMNVWDDANDRPDLDQPPDVTIDGMVCENTWQGVITSNHGGRLVIRNSTIVGGSGEFGRGHPVYAGAIDAVTVDNLTVLGHRAAGHLFKSRAPVNTITASTFDGLDTSHSRIFDFPCGGQITIADSTMTQSPSADNEDLIALAVETANCGADMVGQSLLTLRDTAWTAQRPGARRFMTTQQTVRTVLEGVNTFEGVDGPDGAVPALRQPQALRFFEVTL